MNTVLDTETWYCFLLQFWRDGKTHIESMDEILSTLDEMTITGYSKTSASIRLKDYPTYLVYEIEQLPKTEENEKYLKEIENRPENNIKTMGYPILGIWRYSFKDIR